MHIDSCIATELKKIIKLRYPNNREPGRRHIHERGPYSYMHYAKHIEYIQKVHKYSHIESEELAC